MKDMERDYSMRMMKVMPAVIALSLIGLSVTGQAFAQVQRDREADWRADYARDYREGIVQSQLSPSDTADFLAALRGEVAPPWVGSRHDDVQALAAMPSLRTIGQRLRRLRDVGKGLQRRYRLERPRSVGGDRLLIEDSEAPSVPVDPVIYSWRSIEDAVSSAPAALLERPQKPAPPLAVPRKWHRPIRIASTGNAEYDALAADVIRELRRSNPRLPIDDRSFPNPVEQANVFLDWRGIQCREGAACRSFDTGPALRAANRRYHSSAADSAMFQALALFDQLQSGRWTPRSEIVPLGAYSGLHFTAAWLRAGGDGQINAAACTTVTGPGTEGQGRLSPRGSEPPARATRDEIRRSIRSCVGAAMGAPSVPPQWSVRMIPVLRLAGPDQAGTYTQEEMLHQIYR